MRSRSRPSPSIAMISILVPPRSMPSLINLDVKLFQLFCVDRRRCAGHEVCSGGRFGERHHFSDRRLARENGADAIDAERNAAVRRRAVFERVEKEAEPRARFLVFDPEAAEDAAL